MSNECFICLSSICQPTITRCGHAFCDTCISAWKDGHNTRPLCRQALMEDANIEWDVSGILDFERRRVTLPDGIRRREAFYLISWRGFPAEEGLWEPASNIECPTLILEFWDRRRVLGLDGRTTRVPGNVGAVWAN